MREVYINDQRVDVNQNDAVDIIYESPIFSDITKIKSNGTTTYTLPKTDRNLAIIRHADLHDVENSLGYVEMKFEEYRDGLPIIQNGRCRILKIADKIELGVVWGIKVALTELLGVKLNEITPSSNKPICRWGADHYLMVDDPESKDYGMLYTNETYPSPLPCANVSGILDLIGDYANIQMSYDKMKEVFKKRWVPCLSKSSNDETAAYTTVTLTDYKKNGEIAKVKKTGQDLYGFLEKENENDAGEYFDFYRAKEKATYEVAVRGWVKVGKDVNEKDKFLPQIMLAKEKGAYRNNGVTNKNILWNVNFKSRKELEDGVQYFEIESNIVDIELEKDEKIYTSIYLSRYNGRAYVYQFPEFDNSSSGLEVNVSLSITYKGKTLEGGYFPIVENLPDMTCIDFIKNICQMYALFPYFDFEKRALQFLSLDDIYHPDNVENAKNWDNKVLVEDWTIERTFGDYAQRNRFSYAEDETVKTKSADYLILENETLDKEKDLVDLKFSTSDNSYNGTIASLPFWKKKDGTTNEYELQTLKPRILGERKVEVKSGENYIDYKSLVFDSSLKFEGEDGLLKVYYDRYQGVVSKPVLREVTVMLSPVEIMQISTLDIIYLRGRYWMPQKIQVGVDGKAKVRLILLPNAFK